MEIFFWVITTVYWVIFFPFQAIVGWKASQIPEAKLLKRVCPGKYYQLFYSQFAKYTLVGIALIGCLIYFS